MKLLYFYDALCGWCYGFSGQVAALRARWAERPPGGLAAAPEWDALSGGMILGERRGPFAGMRAYIERVLPRLESLSGMEFSAEWRRNILESDSEIMDSSPPALALAAYKLAGGGDPAGFAGAIQRSHFGAGRSLNAAETYFELAAAAGLDAEAYRSKLAAAEAADLANAEIAFTKQLGVDGFPTVVLERGGKLFLVARGFTPAAELEANFLRSLEAEGGPPA